MQTCQALYTVNFHVVNIYSIITSKFCASQSTKSAVLKYFLLCLISGTESLSINLKKINNDGDYILFPGHSISRYLFVFAQAETQCLKTAGLQTCGVAD